MFCAWSCESEGRGEIITSAPRYSPFVSFAHLPAVLKLFYTLHSYKFNIFILNCSCIPGIGERPDCGISGHRSKPCCCCCCCFRAFSERTWLGISNSNSLLGYQLFTELCIPDPIRKVFPKFPCDNTIQVLGPSLQAPFQ